MSKEIELKLSLDPKAAARVARLPILQRLAAGKPAIRSLRSTYYDTPDAALRSAHLSLRVRRVGRAWVQTLKADGTAAGGLHVRIESEQRVAIGALDPGKIEDARTRKKLCRLYDRGELAPRFETFVRRTTWLLHTADGGVVECALDRGRVQTADGRRHAPLCEVELELKSGSPAALYDIARELSRSLPLKPEDRSKAERGYALWLREPLTKPSKASVLLLNTQSSAGEALAQILRNGLAHLQRNCHAAQVSSRYDPEHVHQMRIASRRLRAALGLFAQTDSALQVHALEGELRWLAGLAGDARNWDVFLAETLPKFAATFPAEPALRILKRRAGMQRRRARLALGAALHSSRYFALELDISELVTALDQRPALALPVLPAAASVLALRDRRLRKRARNWAELAAPDRHALRIAAKKLRYTAEFFGALFPGRKLDRFLRKLSALQDTLGFLNDLATMRALLCELPAGQGARVQRALGLCIGWSTGLEEGNLKEVERSWKGVKQAPRFWTGQDR